MDKKDPVDVSFFIKLFESVFNTSIQTTTNIDTADILVESMMGNISCIDYKKWKYSFLFIGESYYSNVSKQNLEKYTCILGFEASHKNFIQCPLFIPYIICNSCEYIQNFQVPPTRASVVISNGSGKERNLFLDKLEKKIQVLYGGRYKNNMGGIIGGLYNSNNLLSFYGQTKFAITMENSKEEYYITEKLINGLRSGVIPVYWGSPNVTKYFNPKRLLILEDISDKFVDDLIERMIKMTDEEYLSIIKEPIFIRNIEDIFQDLVESIKSLVL